MVRNPFRVERERKKNFEKFAQKCPIEPPYRAPAIINRTVKARKKAFFSCDKRVKIHENESKYART